MIIITTLFVVPFLVCSRFPSAQADGTWEYKPPCAYDVPQQFNVTILPNLSFNKGTMGAKATGEPPKILSYSIFSGIRAAINASRKERGLAPAELRQPAIPTNVVTAAGVAAAELTLN
jgi:xanthine dehydrogenase large subunit